MKGVSTYATRPDILSELNLQSCMTYNSNKITPRFFYIELAHHSMFHVIKIVYNCLLDKS